MTISLIEVPFLTKHINPLCLKTIKGYWQALNQASKDHPEEVKTAKYNLWSFLCRRVFKDFYQVPDSLKGDLFLLTHIHGDGVGDYFALLKSASILQSAFPSLTVHLVYKHQKQLPKIDYKTYGIDPSNVYGFEERSSNSILESVLEGKDCSYLDEEYSNALLQSDQFEQDISALKLRDKQAVALEELFSDSQEQIRRLERMLSDREQASLLYEKLKKGLALVHIALAINTFDNPVLASKSIYFSEAGNFQGIGNWLSRQWYSMGFEPFEEGLFLKSDSHSVDWQSPNWVQFIKSRKESAPLYFGYFNRIEKQRLLFIYLIAAKHKQDSQELTIVLPLMKKEELDHLNIRWLKEQNIGKILWIDFNHQSEEEISIEGQSSQNLLRIISWSPIPQSDFRKLMSASGFIVGCTGDMSLGECLGFGKLPFYEQRPHKAEIWNALIAIASYLHLSEIENYLTLVKEYESTFPEEMAEKISFLIESFTFETQWKDLLKFLQQHYTLEDGLVQFTARHLITQAYPKFIDLEDSIIKKTFSQEMSLDEGVELLKSQITL